MISMIILTFKGTIVLTGSGWVQCRCRCFEVGFGLGSVTVTGMLVDADANKTPGGLR